VLIGLRDVDAGERKTIRERGVRAYTMTDIDRLGMERVIEEAIAIVGTAPRSVHVSFRSRRHRSERGPGRGYAGSRRRISYREAHLAMEALAAAESSARWNDRNQPDPRRRATARPELAVELILSVLGKTIL